MDIFFEQTVTNNSLAKQLPKVKALKIARTLITMVIVAGIMIGVLLALMQTTVTAFIIVLAITAFALVPFVLIFFLFGKKILDMCCEYDYTLSGRTFRIMRVFKVRKKFIECSIDSFLAFGKITDESYARFENNRQNKKMFAICNYTDKSALGYILLNQNGTNILLHYEPSQEMLIALRRNLPRLASYSK